MSKINDVDAYEEFKSFTRQRRKEFAYLKDIAQGVLIKMAKILDVIAKSYNNHIEHLAVDCFPMACLSAMDGRESAKYNGFYGKMTEVVLNFEDIKEIKKLAIKYDFQYAVKETSDGDTESLKSQGIENTEDYKVFIYKNADKDKVAEAFKECVEKKKERDKSLRKDIENYKQKADKYNKSREQNKEKNLNENISR